MAKNTCGPPQQIMYYYIVSPSPQQPQPYSGQGDGMCQGFDVQQYSAAHAQGILTGLEGPVAGEEWASGPGVGGAGCHGQPPQFGMQPGMQPAAVAVGQLGGAPQRWPQQVPQAAVQPGMQQQATQQPQQQQSTGSKKKMLTNKKVDKPGGSVLAAREAPVTEDATPSPVVAPSASPPLAAAPNVAAQSTASASNSGYASSIMALNLEPIRANLPQHRPANPLQGPRTELPQQLAQQVQLQMPRHQMPTPAFMAQQMQPPAPLTAPTASPLTKRKGLMIKNVSLSKSPGAAAPEGASPALRRDKEEAAWRAQDRPAEEDAAPPPREDVVPGEELAAAPGAQPARADAEPALREPQIAAPAAGESCSGVIDRQLMLRIWRLQPKEVHDAVNGLCTSARPREVSKNHKRVPRERNQAAPRHHEPADRAAMFSTDMKPARKKDALSSLSTTENAYQVAFGPLTRRADLERSVRGLLNRICPDNLATIVERLARVSLDTASELELVITIIFQKALSDSYYCETYADMVFALQSRYPEFPPENEGEKPHTFTRALLNTCQNEFESLPSSLEPTDEERSRFSVDDLRLFLKKRKDKVLANMKFIGNLFLRQLLAVKVVGRVVHDLIGIKEDLPEEHMIECVCELLQAIGYTLDATQQGRPLMTQFAARLAYLRQFTDLDIGVGGRRYSKRIQFIIQGLLELRGNSWQKKLFKEPPKKKDEVRKDMQKDLRMQAKGGAEVAFSTATVGVRPAYIDELKSSSAKSVAKEPAHPAKPSFDQAYVQRLFQYYAEEKSSEGLVNDWNKGSPSAKEVTKGAGWLVEIGYKDASKEDAVAKAVVELMRRKCVGWENLQDAISSGPVPLEDLEDFMVDVPTADRFFHSLLARLLFVEGLPFKNAFLRCLPSKPEVTLRLLMGGMRRLKKVGGTDAVRKALDIKDLASKIAEAKSCALAGLRREMQREGIL